MTARKPEPEITLGERLLDEAYLAVRDYLSVTESQAVAMVLYAAATHAVRSFPAFGRVLFTGDGPECGKTVAMLVTAYLSSNPQNTTGSSYGLTSALAQATNSPETPTPTLYRDEISQVFGRSGLNNSRDPIATVLREGYKRGATTQWSVNRVAEKIGIYVPCLMAGNGTAVPLDVRSRSIVVKMERGRPALDLDSDGSQERLEDISSAVGAEVRRHASAMRGYTCEGLVPGLTARRHQVYRPLIAVAKYVGGPKWLTRALMAFGDLTQTGTASEILSPIQSTLRDLVAITEDLDLKPSDHVGGHALAEELSGLDRFEGRTSASLTHDVARAMEPVKPSKRKAGEDRARGYTVRDILARWDAARPASPEEITSETLDDPFA